MSANKKNLKSKLYACLAPLVPIIENKAFSDAVDALLYTNKPIFDDERLAHLMKMFGRQIPELFKQDHQKKKPFHLFCENLTYWQREEELAHRSTVSHSASTKLRS